MRDTNYYSSCRHRRGAGTADFRCWSKSGTISGTGIGPESLCSSQYSSTPAKLVTVNIEQLGLLNLNNGDNRPTFRIET